MPRDEKQIPQLRTVDEHSPSKVEVVRLQHPSQTEGAAGVVRLSETVKLSVEPDRRQKTQNKIQQQLEHPPQRKAGALRSFEPGVEEIINRIPASLESVEQPWGSGQGRRPVPWGWFTLIGALMTVALIWSLTRVEDAKAGATEVRQQAVVAEQSAAQEELEALRTIDQLEHAIRDYYDAASAERLIPRIRHPERVGPLLRQYYAGRKFFQPRLRAIRNLQPAILGVEANFWSATVVVTDQVPQVVFVEITPQGPKVDWETAVGYQPMPWDDYVSQRPKDKAMDFRVVVKPDQFFSHEFPDNGQWKCFQLSVPGSVETLFGYVRADSEASRQLEDFFERNAPNQKMILRLVIPEGIQSPRGVVIDRFMSSRWMYLESPTEAH